MNILFKLETPIRRSSLKEFRAANPGVIPTKDADLTEFGFAWGAAEAQPEVTSAQKAVPADPALSGAFVSQGWTIRDKTTEELLAEIPWQTATEARKAVVEWIDGLTSQIEALYPSSVQKRWLIEEAAARAVFADDGSATQDQIDMMTNEGAAKGRTAAKHAAAVIANADRFRAIVDETNKLFLATDKRIQDAASPLEYPAIFEWAKQQAAPLAAAYGLNT